MSWKRLLAAVGLLLVVGAGAAFGWVQSHDQPRTVRGSPTVEFETKQRPVAERPRPQRQAPLPEAWKTYGYDLARTHSAGFALRPPFRRLWTVRTGYYIEFPPAVAHGRVFVAQLRGRFFSIDSGSGKIRFQKRFHHCTAASPTVSNNVVYQPYLPQPCDDGDRSKRGFIVAMRARGSRVSRAGRIIWKVPLTTESSLLLHDHVLYFGSWDHHVYALDIRTRKVRWKFRADDEVNSSAAYAGNTIYIGSNGGTLYALNARTGRLRWKAHSFWTLRLGREYFYATPTVAYGRVYAGNSDGIVYAFGAHTGHLLWARRTGPYVYSAPAVWKKTIYVGSYDGKLYALDAATGDVKWTFQSPSAIHGAPTVMGGLVYFSSCGTCGRHNIRKSKQGRRGTYAVDARTGKLVWAFYDGKYSPLAADRKRMYIVGQTRVYGFEPRRARKR